MQQFLSIVMEVLADLLQYNIVKVCTV